MSTDEKRRVGTPLIKGLEANSPYAPVRGNKRAELRMNVISEDT
jgi:hypothetical protein